MKSKVYYDGLCRLCSKEIDHYKSQKGSENLIFIDITDPSFDAQKEGVDPVRVHKVMHVRRADGSLATEVDAFIEIWKHLPKYHWAHSAAQTLIVRKALDVFYVLFALVRPYLPKKKRDCDTSPYCEVKDV